MSKDTKNVVREALMKNWVAEGIASYINDFNAGISLPQACFTIMLRRCSCLVAIYLGVFKGVPGTVKDS